MSDAPFAQDGSADFMSLADLFSDATLDSIWLDLDGDQVPDTQISSYDMPSGDSDPFTVTDELAEEVADAGTGPQKAGFQDGTDGDATATDTTATDGAEYDSWISIETTDDAGYPLYDVYELIPDQSVPYTDWTDQGAYGYDPMQMWNFCVDAGPVIVDPSSGMSYTTADYTDPSLWFNESSFDSGAGYWDPAYAVMPTQPDLSQWQPTPDSYVPNGFDVSSDPFSYTSTMPTSYDAMDTSAYAMDGTGVPASTYSYTTPSYDSSAYTSWDSSSSWDGSSPTDVSSSYFTDYSFDDQLSQASEDSQFWMDQYDQASDLSWDYWQASVDASTAGDSSLAYDYNQLSLQSSSYADTAWSASSSAWDTSYSSSTSSYSADDGWYDAMSLDY